MVLISGNVPFETQVASLCIYGRIESDNPDGAAAISVRAAGASPWRCCC